MSSLNLSRLEISEIRSSVKHVRLESEGVDEGAKQDWELVDSS
jgi:hypothetical protein